MRRYTIFYLSILISCVMSCSSYAQPSPDVPPDSGILYGIRFGLLVHDIGGLWSNTRSEEGVDFNAEVVFRKPSFMLWKGVVLPNIGLSINSHGDTSKIYGGVLWEFLFSNGLFLNIGTGLAVHDGQLESNNGDKKQLGSRVLFRTPIEFGFTFYERHRISILFDHISNADLARPNEGLDTLGVRYGFQF
jgi:lipid A 3-O-deacylase